MATENTTKPANKATERFDPFHPDMPRIPGVRSQNSSRTGGTNMRRVAQIGGAVAATLLAGAIVIWALKSARARLGITPVPETAEVSPQPSPIPAPVISVPDSEGRTAAATVEELAKPWAARQFTFVTPLTREKVDAMVIRLPGGGIWAFSLQEPYGQCKLEYVPNLDRLAKQYGYHAVHPMVVNPCNNTIYDPLKVGPLGGDVWARGEIVQGGGLRPPISIDVRVSGHFIVADRIE